MDIGDQGISAILLFGSRAREDNGRGSDTDLLLISPPGTPQHKSIGHLSMFFYPWEKLTNDAREGDLFVCHIVREAKPVFDFDSVSLLETVRTMRDESRFLSGRKLDLEPRMFAGASINPFAPPYANRVDQFAKKVAAGAQFVQSQYCFDLDMARDFMARSRDLGLTERCYVLMGVGVLASAKTARWLKSAIPGVHIPEHIIRRLEQAEKPKAEGRAIAIELMQQLAEIDGISGIHLMAYKQEEWIGEIVTRSGVLSGREPWAPTHLDHLKQPASA